MNFSIRRGLVWLLSLLLLLSLVYVVALNGFLNSGWIRSRINKRPDRLKMDYTWTWCLWPTQVVLGGFRLQGGNEELRWKLRLDRARATVRFEELFDRRFHALDVEGSGFTVEIDLLPGAEPGADAPEPPRPAADPPKRPWTIHLDRIRISRFRELRFGSLRFAGQIRLDGHFFFRPKELLRIEPTTIVARDMEVLHEGRTVAQVLESRIVASIPETDPKQLKDLDLVRAIRASASVRAAVDGIGFLQRFVERAPLKFEGGGSLQGEVKLDRGAFMPGTHVEIEVPDLRARIPEYTIHGSGRVRWRVREAGNKPDLGTEASLALDLDRFSLQATGFEQPHVQGTGLGVLATGKNTTILDPIQDLVVQLDMPEARIPDVTVYEGLLPRNSRLDLRSGRGSMQLALRASSITNLATGGVTVRASDVLSTWEGLHLGGDWALTTRLRSRDLGQQIYDLSGSVFLLQDVGVIDLNAPLKKREKRKIEDWWGTATLLDAKYTPGRPILLSARLQIRMRDARPVIEIFSRNKKLPGFVRKILVANNLTATGSLKVGEDLVELKDFLLEADKIEIRARLRVRAGQTRGLLYASHGPFSVGVDLKAGDTDLKLIRPKRWFLNYPPFEGR
jgi:hypothetical protein